MKLKYTAYSILFIVTAVIRPSFSQSKDEDMSKMMVDILHGVETTDSSVIIKVWSKGCTKKEDFKIVSEKRNEFSYSLTIYRRKGDVCKGITIPLALEFTKKELGVPEEKMVT